MANYTSYFCKASQAKQAKQAKQQTAAAELGLSLGFQVHRTSPVCTVQEDCL